jgi:hypothetical protein
VRRWIAAVLPALAVVAGCGGGGALGPPQQPVKLVATVGVNDAYTISVTDETGTKIKNLVAGTYTVEIHDASQIHDFHLKGAGVSERTTVEETVTRTLRITFQPGKYSFTCDAHGSSMKGSFHVSAPASPASTP